MSAARFAIHSAGLALLWCGLLGFTLMIGG